MRRTPTLTAAILGVAAAGAFALLGLAAGDEPAAERMETVAHPTAAGRLTPEQVERVAAYVAREIVEGGRIPSAEAIERATGVAPSSTDRPVLQRAVLARLADDPRGQKLLAGSRCSDYGACSLWGNLAGASGETLAGYEKENALDGTTYADRRLPAFAARDLGGRLVHSSDLVGRPALVALLAVHCNHSMDTFPILQDLHRRYAEEGLQVVGVLVNSGSVEEVGSWVPSFAPEYPVWVVSDASLGDLVGSHLVPTTLLVDATGRIRKMLVGYHDEESVVSALELIRARAS